VSLARKWVFPIIRILIFCAIAVALVKIAFFGGATQAQSAAQPTGQITEPTVQVQYGNVNNTVHVDGTVSADAAVPIKATAQGSVVKLLAAQGAQVGIGTPILTIKSDTPGTQRADGSVSPDVIRTITVTSPAAGTLSALPVIAGQSVSVGDAVAQVAPPTYSVSGTLTPAELYRLLNQPTAATVTITGGPAPFQCSGLTIAATLAGADQSSSSGSSDGSTESSGAATTGGTSVSCAVPATVRVFNGLQAKLAIPGGSVTHVLVAPVTAVEGIADVGDVYLVGDTGKAVKTSVKLGLNDGTKVQILSGLKSGDSIREFVPGAKVATDSGCGDGPVPSGVVCEQG
jgi:multidrug efflux pump subunit AcrA (membrane-fusion protein)